MFSFLSEFLSAVYCARNCFFMSSSRVCAGFHSICGTLLHITCHVCSAPFEGSEHRRDLAAIHAVRRLATDLGDMFGQNAIQLRFGSNCVLLAINQRVNQDPTEQFAIMINECPCKSATSRGNQHRQSCAPQFFFLIHARARPFPVRRWRHFFVCISPIFTMVRT